MTKKFACSSIFLLLLKPAIHAQDFIGEKNEAAAFPIVTSSQSISIYVDEIPL